MSLLVNKPSLNQEIVTFFNFMDSLSEIDNVRVIKENNRDIIYSAIESSDCIVFMGHGSKKSIYHYYDRANEEHTILIGSCDYDKIRGKKIFAISCKTGSILGSEAVKNGTLVYMGLKGELELETDNFNCPANGFYMRNLKRRYKKIFKEGLEKAIKENKTFLWLKMYYESKFAKISREGFREFNEIGNEYYRKLYVHELSKSMVNMSQNFIIHGDEGLTF